MPDTSAQVWSFRQKSQQTRQQNDQQIVKLNSILKNGLTQSDIDEKKMPDVQRKYKHSKSVQINNDDSIYGKILITNKLSNKLKNFKTLRTII